VIEEKLLLIKLSPLGETVNKVPDKMAGQSSKNVYQARNIMSNKNTFRLE
jgi:hypothetical protein